MMQACTHACAKAVWQLRRNYAWEKIAKQYLQLFEELMAERARDSRDPVRFAVADPSVSV